MFRLFLRLDLLTFSFLHRAPANVFLTPWASTYQRFLGCFFFCIVKFCSSSLLLLRGCSSFFFFISRLRHSSLCTMPRRHCQRQSEMWGITDGARSLFLESISRRCTVLERRQWVMVRPMYVNCQKPPPMEWRDPRISWLLCAIWTSLFPPRYHDPAGKHPAGWAVIYSAVRLRCGSFSGLNYLAPLTFWITNRFVKCAEDLQQNHLIIEAEASSISRACGGTFVARSPCGRRRRTSSPWATL